MCSYPLCSSSSQRPYTAQSHYTFRTTGVISSSRTSRNRDLIRQEEGNKDDGFCCKDCLIRSRWFGRRLRDEAIWTRNEVGPGDYGRYKSKARGDPQLEERRIELEIELLEEMEDRGEVLLQDGHIYMQGSFPAGEPSAVRSAVPALLVPSVEGAKVKPELPLNGLVKMGLVAETREHPSRFEDQLNATLAGLHIVERVPSGTARPPSEGKNLTGTSNSESQSYIKMEPKSVKELLPRSQRGNALSSTVEYAEQEEDDEEDEEVRMAFEAAYAAREMLRSGDFE
jgi:hypothetical protein